MNSAMKLPLHEALEKMKEAERKASLPMQVEIVKAVNKILKQEGLAIGAPGAKKAKGHGGTRKRIAGTARAEGNNRTFYRTCGTSSRSRQIS